MDKSLVSKFNLCYDKVKICDITLRQYINMVKNGDTRDIVERGRAQKQIVNNSSPENEKAEKTKYKAIKSKCPCVTGSMTSDFKGRDKNHIDKVNGYIVIDIDDEVNESLINELKADKYTAILHRSFGGDGICIFIRINANIDSFKNSYLYLEKYYFDTYGVVTDRSCKDVTRLRYISFDPDIFVNENAEKCSVRKSVIKPAPVIDNFVFVKSDFTDLIRDITSRHINIAEAYNDYFNCAAAISAEFGYAGLDYFLAVASQSAKYETKECRKLYLKCCERGDLGIKIGTLYYYAKQAGLEIYSERTKQIVRTASIQKQNKRATGDSGNGAAGTVKSLELKGIDVSDDEKELVNKIWTSKNDMLKGVTAGDSPIDKLISYIFENHDYYYDEIKNRIFIGGSERRLLTDKDLNNLYIGASSLYDGDFVVRKTDIAAILNSDYIRIYNPIKEFFDVDIDTIKDGYIEAYAKMLPTVDQDHLDHLIWMLTHYLVGAIHNWTCSPYDMEVCPFVLVLTGEQGNGKSSFIRNLLPSCLRREYFIEERIDSTNKDSRIKMGQYLLLSDEEFGGLAMKDVKAFKGFTDTRIIDERQAYRANSEVWKRRAMLAGTTNDRTIMKDVTGNRRIMPVNTYCGKINYDKIVKFDTDSLLFEAYKLYKNGYKWQIFSKEDKDYLNKYNEDLELSDPYADLFFMTFSIEKNNEFCYPAHMKTGQILDWFGRHTTLRVNQHNVTDMMRGVNVTQQVVKINGKSTRGYKLYSRIAPFRDTNNDDSLPF